MSRGCPRTFHVSFPIHLQERGLSLRGIFSSSLLIRPQKFSELIRVAFRHVSGPQKLLTGLTYVQKCCGADGIVPYGFVRVLVSDLNHPSHSNFGGVVELVESEQWLTWLIA
jgi:hypothetical protein